MAARDEYCTKHYHQPPDEFDPHWDVSGPIDDLLALYTLGDTLANSRRWPNWYKDNEFRAIRDKELAARKSLSPLRKRSRPVYGTAPTP